MREYGQIQCAFWQHARENEWSSDATLLGAYLLTGPHSNGIGCYRLPDGYIADDLGWSSERVSETVSELLSNGFINRFGMVVLIPKFMRWNGVSNSNVAKARQGEFEAIPNDEAKNAAARVLLEFGNHWAKGFADRLETLSKGYGKQNPTLTNPTQPESKSAIADSSAGDEPPADPGEDDDSKTPNVPHQEIIAAYHRILPELPRVRVWDTGRQAYLRSRWREATERQTVEWWAEFFEYVRRCPFLLGQGTSGDRDPFLADLEWLIRPQNFRKVIEGKYERRAA